MINVEKLKKVYPNFTLECSLKVKAGSITALIGANGSGKSTTFKAILDLIKYDSGSVEVLNSKYHLSVSDKQAIGTVLSDSGFSGYLTIKDVRIILNNLFENFEAAKFDRLVNEHKLPINKRLKDFSSGMQAKFKIIVATTHQAKLLILDEPTAGLDVIGRDDLLMMLRLYMEENPDNAILISSHISSDLENLCDDVYMIDDGKIIMHENIDTLLNDFMIIKVSTEEFTTLDQSHILKIKQEQYGYKVLVKSGAYYRENYPNLVIEKSSLDEIIFLMIKGENLCADY